MEKLQLPDSLYELLEACTVRVDAGYDQGTGFFVAPGLVLTCAHVIGDLPPSDIHVVALHLDGADRIVRTVLARESTAYPDLALLEIDLVDHPCVYLDADVEPYDALWIYSYTPDRRAGEPTSLENVGYQQSEPGQELLKLKLEQVKPGMSGSPVLNKRTWGVCGMIKSTRDASIALGGSAIPTQTILRVLPDLADMRDAFHAKDSRWDDLRQAQRLIDVSRREIKITFYDNEQDLEKRPLLVGRNEILAQASNLLQEGHHLELHGLGGTGKTAIARELVHRHLQAQNGAVLWIDCGSGEARDVFDALLRHFKPGGAIPPEEDLASAVGEELAQCSASLVILDNVWNGTALYAILELLPARMPVLITSREAFPNLKRLPVGDLSPEEAIDLLCHYANAPDLINDPNAARLCEVLGFHAYALQIAGATLEIDEFLAPADLIRQIAASPHDLSMPGEFSQKGRENVGKLLEVSLVNLDPALRRVWLAFGAFPSPGLSATLLATYLDQEKTSIEVALRELARRSLLVRSTAEFYDLHDLTYSYLRAKNTAARQESEHLLAALEAYVAAHKQDNALLSSDMANILAASDMASLDTIVRVMSYLVTGGYPAPTPQERSYFEERGHSLALLERLDRAIEAARQSGSEQALALHYLLGRRGNAYFDRGELAAGLRAYQEALDLAPNANRKIKLLAAVGAVLDEQGQHETSDEYLSQAHTLAIAEGDDDALGFVLEYRSHLANQRNDYPAARTFATDAVKLNRRLNDLPALGFALLNLGAAEHELGNLGTAVNAHQEALEIARAEGDLILTADVLHALSEDYHQLGQRNQAQVQLREALALCRQVGDKLHEDRLLEFMQANGYLSTEGN